MAAKNFLFNYKKSMKKSQKMMRELKIEIDGV